MNAAPMVAACYLHQWPADFGRDFIAYAREAELEPVRPRVRETLHDTAPLTAWCDRCACDHSRPVIEIRPLEEFIP